MKTLEQYVEEACKDYTHACVKVYRKDRTKPYKQISGDIDFVSNYFKKDHFGSLLILSGRFSPGECHAAGFFTDCTCTYRLCDTH